MRLCPRQWDHGASDCCISLTGHRAHHRWHLHILHLHSGLRRRDPREERHALVLHVLHHSGHHPSIQLWRRRRERRFGRLERHRGAPPRRPQEELPGIRLDVHGHFLPQGLLPGLKVTIPSPPTSPSPPPPPSIFASINRLQNLEFHRCMVEESKTFRLPPAPHEQFSTLRIHPPQSPFQTQSLQDCQHHRPHIRGDGILCLSLSSMRFRRVVHIQRPERK